MDTRIFVHKKEQFQVESESLAAELRQSLSLKEDFGLTKYNLYDIFNADENDIENVKLFNNLVTVFPTSLTNTLLFHHTKKAQFTVSEEVQKAPEVKF